MARPHSRWQIGGTCARASVPKNELPLGDLPRRVNVVDADEWSGDLFGGAPKRVHMWHPKPSAAVSENHGVGSSILPLGTTYSFVD